MNIALHVKAGRPCLLLLTVRINLRDLVLKDESVVPAGQLGRHEPADSVSLVNNSPFILKRPLTLYP